ncbi:MAG: hypothetical protein ACE14L_01245 [Terriglobales bacterium]
MTGDKLTLLAQPWWVNLLILVPFLAYLGFRRSGLSLPWRSLFASGLFAVAFGYLEAAVVVYIRAAIGLLPGFQGTLEDVRRLSAPLYRQPVLEIQMSPALIEVELFREAATILMLASVALLVGRTRADRWAAFLWCFALWDVTYYAGLWATVRWPYSLLAPDVLFLIPVPWVSQVWYPVLVSLLCVAAVLVANAQHRPKRVSRFAEPVVESESA